MFRALQRLTSLIFPQFDQLSSSLPPKERLSSLFVSTLIMLYTHIYISIQSTSDELKQSSFLFISVHMKP